ncbi:MAG TPA: 6-phosphogluconolactonase, partial [Acidimicrobiales bacterium]|nr:6-phosphogluconolactonase [Acidimicrobiales bacterium]
MNGELCVVDDVPGEFAERVIESFHNRPGEGFSLALSGGETARACYERLATEGASQIDWWLVDVYWSDERCVPADSEDSNERLGREALLERVGAANAVYPMRSSLRRETAKRPRPPRCSATSSMLANGASSRCSSARGRCRRESSQPASRWRG